MLTGSSLQTSSAKMTPNEEETGELSHWKVLNYFTFISKDLVLDEVSLRFSSPLSLLFYSHPKSNVGFVEYAVLINYGGQSSLIA